MPYPLNILILGGDKRYIEVINDLSHKDVHLLLIGYDHLTFNHTNVEQLDITNVDFSKIDVILLPIGGLDETGKIQAVYTNKTFYLTEQMIKRTPDHCILYTGRITPHLEKLSKKYNRKLINMLSQDDVAILNSIPTAEGTLQLALENTDITLHGSDVLVFGFGRVGKTTARLFSSIGADVRVAVRKRSDMARIKEMRLTPITYSDVKKQIPNIDVCINTVPYPVLDDQIISYMKKTAIIIDVASSPGGTDFQAAEKSGIHAIHALGLPGKHAPKTAGKIIAQTLIHLLEEQK